MIRSSMMIMMMMTTTLMTTMICFNKSNYHNNDDDDYQEYYHINDDNNDTTATTTTTTTATTTTKTKTSTSTHDGTNRILVILGRQSIIIDLLLFSCFLWSRESFLFLLSFPVLCSRNGRVFHRHVVFRQSKILSFLFFFKSGLGSTGTEMVL